MARPSRLPAASEVRNFERGQAAAHQTTQEAGVTSVGEEESVSAAREAHSAQHYQAEVLATPEGRSTVGQISARTIGF